MLRYNENTFEGKKELKSYLENQPVYLIDGIFVFCLERETVFTNNNMDRIKKMFIKRILARFKNDVRIFLYNGSIRVSVNGTKVSEGTSFTLNELNELEQR